MMKKMAGVFLIVQLFAAVAALAAPPLPAGWHAAEWWDLGGRDRSDVVADFNGDGTVDIATVAIRDDRDAMGLLVWLGNPQGGGKWAVLNEQKIPKSLADFGLEAVTNDDHPKQSKIVYCLAARECMVFTWDDKAGSYKRGMEARKPASKNKG